MRKQTNTFLDDNPTSYDLKVAGRRRRTDTGDLGSGVNWVGKKGNFWALIFFGIKMMLILEEEVAQPQHMSETLRTVMGNKRQGSIIIYY